ncbi:MAG: LysM peptidoglycan-binding domain-containing protein [Campylobacterota bacterium]|nr:LysM peptidoglycan-binding domain-containing protein [Campylobacterota bacterium]
MYNRKKGELKYCPQTGEYYYECDRKLKDKSILVGKIFAVVIAIVALMGVLYWLNQKNNPASSKPQPSYTPTPQPTKITQDKSKVVEKTIETTPTPTPEPVKTKPNEIKKEKPQPTPTAIPTTTSVKENNTTIVAKEKSNSNPQKNTTAENNSSDTLFDRGAKKVFFTSMGKSVDGAVIKKNVQEVNLSVDDSKAKKEIQKEQKKVKKEKKPKKDITYTIKVKKGDTIYKIAKRVYGSSKGYKKILKANKLRSNSSLKIGQKLVIPPK